MLFNSLIFLFAFLPVTYVVFWLLRSAPSRYLWLTVSGYIFYGYWDPRFVLLMLFSTIVSYVAGLGILKYGYDPKKRRTFLIVPIILDLSLLGFFKYAGFVTRSINDALALIGIETHLPVLDIILPIGISFYTFHTISYIVDSYRGDIQPTRNFFEFSAYVSLFSQLVAGPIVRFRQIEQDLESLGRADRTRWLGLGVSFFIFGLVEKVLVADTLAHFVDPAFGSPAELSKLGVVLAVLGYSCQLYFDFSGYSSMAVGLGLMFGLRIPQNFNSPYKALSPSDFWKRWHISLSSCLRDYVYVPLGGNRKGGRTTYRNLMLTMLIGGLWHGANWTFVVWGGYHGFLLVLYRAYFKYWDRLPPGIRRGLMFVLVVIGWVPFRCESFGDVATMFRRVVEGPAIVATDLSHFYLSVLAIAIVWALKGPNVFDFHQNYSWKRWHMIPAGFLFGICLAVITGVRDSPFLYFQF